MREKEGRRTTSSSRDDEGRKEKWEQTGINSTANTDAKSPLRNKEELVEVNAGPRARGGVRIPHPGVQSLRRSPGVWGSNPESSREGRRGAKC